uniref:Uncharacterized protein n=1 Tax=Branchiostoma floridae TaxID=7739 RepID=C3Y4R5_BRAFL|eukprot:XP_002608712.1 hypothetical protein BRAFLDRAFT_73932 [Branchiostoma floridae]
MNGHPGSVDPGTSSAVKLDVSSPVAELEVSPLVAVVEPSEDVLSEAAPSLTKFSPVAVVEPSEDVLSEAAPSLAKPGLSSSSSEQVPSTSAAPVPAPRTRSQRRRRKAASPIRPVTRRYMCQGCELDYTITLEVVSCHQCKADITPESALLAFCEGPVCQGDDRLFLCQSCHDGNSDIADKDSRKRCRGDSSEGSASAKTLSKGKKIRKEPDSDSSLVIEEFPSDSLRSVDGNESDSTVGSRSLIIDEDISDASQAPSPDLVAKARAIVISSDLYKNKAVFVCNQFLSHGCDELLHSFRSLKSHLAKAHGISGDIVPYDKRSRRALRPPRYKPSCPLRTYSGVWYTEAKDQSVMRLLQIRKCFPRMWSTPVLLLNRQGFGVFIGTLAGSDFRGRLGARSVSKTKTSGVFRPLLFRQAYASVLPKELWFEIYCLFQWNKTVFLFRVRGSSSSFEVTQTNCPDSVRQALITAGLSSEARRRHL